MKVSLRLSCLLVALVVSAGCARRVSLAIPPSTPIIVSYDGNPSELGWSDPREGQLKRWLASNQSGWSPYYVTPFSGGVLVQAGDLRVQFSGSTALVTTPAGMYTKSVKPSDYEFLRVSPAAGKSP